ncbi:MAG: hypothetical protein JWN98_202 [Abditibacteriota bacterium]|nr:hypothetical protein [Abditibacteriota bacterium]
MEPKGRIVMRPYINCLRSAPSAEALCFNFVPNLRLSSVVLGGHLWLKCVSCLISAEKRL